MVKLVCDFCRNEILIMDNNPEVRVYNDRDFIKYDIRKVDKYGEAKRLDVCGECLDKIEKFLDSLTVSQVRPRPHIEQPR